MAKEAPPQEAPVIAQELGTLEVAEAVFHDLFAEAIEAVPGVAGVSRTPGGIFHRSRDTVRVERGAGEVAFSVNLSVTYDVNIPSLAGELRRLASDAIEELTGYRVRAVNITIDHILPPRPLKAEEDKPIGDNIPELPPVPDEE